jgi:hypothetical protein
MDGIDQYDLLAVADRVAAEPEGLRLLKDSILRVADFIGARCTYAHAALGLLVCEGTVTVLETNYDNCIERAALPELVSVAVTDSDRIDVDVAALLKIHGCATRPDSMLVTTKELEHPPLFASSELAARLSMGSVAFVGIGSPADYVKSSLHVFVDRVGVGRLTVVDPKMVDWASTGWSAVLEGLPEGQRVADSADAFCDALLRAYVRELVGSVRRRVGEMGDAHPQRLGSESVLRAFEGKDSVWVLRWLRAVAWRFGVGQPVVTSSRVIQGLLALGGLAGDQPLAISAKGWSRISPSKTNAATSDVPVMLLVAEGAPLGSEMAIEALRRVGDARTEDRLPSGAEVVVVCCGHAGPLGGDELAVQRGNRMADVVDALVGRERGLPDDLIDEADSQHLINSTSVGRVVLITGEILIEAT